MPLGSRCAWRWQHLEHRWFHLAVLDTEQNWPSSIEWANAGWFRLRHSRIVDNAVALYVVHLANYLLPLITVPYIVRVLAGLLVCLLDSFGNFQKRLVGNVRVALAFYPFFESSREGPPP
jgi:hypothetical protein